MATYQWGKRGKNGLLWGSTGGPYRAVTDPQIVGEELDRLRHSAAGLTKSSLVEASKPDDAPLHGCFEWDDAVAGDKFRHIQAGTLIQAVYVVLDESAAAPQTTRAFYSVHPDDEDARGNSRYEPAATVLNDAALYAQICRRACAELESFQDRYSQFESLKQIGKMATDAVRAELAATISKAETAA